MTPAFLSCLLRVALVTLASLLLVSGAGANPSTTASGVSPRELAPDSPSANPHVPAAPPAGATANTTHNNAGRQALQTNPGLRLAVSTVQFPQTTISSVDQTVAAQPVTWEAEDSTGSGAGWHVTITATNFTSSAGSIAAANLQVRLLNSTITRVSGTGGLPVSQVESFQALSPTNALTLLRAATGSGSGKYRFAPDFTLTVPATAAPGAYESSVAVTMIAGP